MCGSSRGVPEQGCSVIKTRLISGVSHTDSSLYCIGMMGRSAFCSDCVYSEVGVVSKLWASARVADSLSWSELYVPSIVDVVTVYRTLRIADCVQEV
jgi:hypothetical protein